MKNLRMHAGLAGAILCLALSGCATAGRRDGPGDSVTAIRVEVDAAGRPALFGQAYTPAALVRRLRREGAGRGRAVALHGGEGTATGTLWALRETLVREGIPNVSVVTARRAIVETSDDDESGPPASGSGVRDATPARRPRRR